MNVYILMANQMHEGGSIVAVSTDKQKLLDRARKEAADSADCDPDNYKFVDLSTLHESQALCLAEGFGVEVRRFGAIHEYWEVETWRVE